MLDLYSYEVQHTRVYAETTYTQENRGLQLLIMRE